MSFAGGKRSDQGGTGDIRFALENWPAETSRRYTAKMDFEEEEEEGLLGITEPGE
jgi:hypothetical protein